MSISSVSPEFQKFMDSFSDPAVPLDTFYQGEGGVFIPLIGLTSDVKSMSIGEDSLACLNYRTWNMTEKLRYRDIFGDYYAAFPRYYYVHSVFEPQGDSRINLAHTRAYDAAARFVLTLRLLHEGLIVDPQRLCAVYNSGGTNFRTAGDVFRMYTWAPQGNIYIPSKKQRYGDDEVFILQSFNQLPSNGYFFSSNELEPFRRIYELVALTEPEQAGGQVGTVIRTFMASHDIWLTESERVVSLLIAFETLFGSVTWTEVPRVFRRICALLQPFDRWNEAEVEQVIKSQYKKIRDAFSHGAERRRDLDNNALELAELALRTGYQLVLKIDAAYRVGQAQSLGLPPNLVRDPVYVVRELLSQVASNNRASQKVLDSLRGWWLS